MYVIGIVVIAIMLFQIVRICFHRVMFSETEIRVPNDKLEKAARIQYETVIPYAEIVDIRLIASSNDSRNKPITARTPNSLSPKTYFEFLMSSGEKKRVFILYFSKKQREKMLSIINEKTGSCYQYDQLLRVKDLG